MEWASFTNRIAMVKRVLGDALSPTHVQAMVAPRVRSSYQADRVARVEAEGLPLAGVEYNIRDQCYRVSYGSLEVEGSFSFKEILQALVCRLPYG